MESCEIKQLYFGTKPASVDIQSSCHSLEWIDGNRYYSNNDTAAYITPHSWGCDSTVTLNLSLTYSSFYTDQIWSCKPVEWIDGNVYASSTHTVQYIISNAAGCDSVISLDLEIDYLNSEIGISTDNLYSMEDSADTYQWVNCIEGYSEIIGETGQFFNPSENGTYAVVMSLNNCIDTSDCFQISTVGLNSIADNRIELYPNPTNGLLTIKSDNPVQSVRIYSLVGKSLLTFLQEDVIDSSYLNDGIYIVEIQDQFGAIMRKRLIKK